MKRSAGLVAAMLGCSISLVQAFCQNDRRSVGPADLQSVLPSATSTAPATMPVTVHVQRFLLDRRPVTNGEFLDFVQHHPQWRRDRIARLFADEDYLSHWAAPGRLGRSVEAEQPVTRVSWFAARAYCEAHDGRLPSWYEWELVAAADEQRADARRDPRWQESILDWYSRPASRPLAHVGLGPANFFGLQDLHGLVWEWVEDFNALMVSSDSRQQGGAEGQAFCGASALSLKDREEYAVLMHIAFLSSLEARSTAHSLGFRCAGDER